MKASRAALESALSLASLATAARSTVDALKHVLIEQEGDLLRFTATDIDTTISAPILCQNGAPFSTLAPATRLLNLVRSIDGDEIEMHVTATNRLRVTSTGHKSELPCLFREEFPRGKDEPLNLLGEIPSGSLLSLLRSSAFCAEAGKDPEAVQVAVSGAELAVASTNHSNGALGIGKLENAIQGPAVSFLLSVWAEPKVEAFIQETDSVILHLGKSTLKIMEAGGRWMVVRLMDTKFPEKLHPTMRGFLGRLDEAVAWAEFSREEALAAMKRLMMFSDASGVTDLGVGFGEELTMATGNADRGRAAEVIRSATLSGKKVTTLLSAPRIYQGLKHTKGDRVRLSLTSDADGAPVTLTNCEKAFGDWIFLSSGVWDRRKEPAKP